MERDSTGKRSVAALTGDFLAFDSAQQSMAEKIGQNRLHQTAVSTVSPLLQIEADQFSKLHQDLLDFVQLELAPKDEEVFIREVVVENLRQAIPFPLRVFGSVSTNLFLPTGDIDLAAEVYGSKTEAKAALNKVASALRKARMHRDLKVIISARVPLVKFQDHLTGLDIDITTHTGPALEAPALIFAFLTKFPPAKPLILFLKYFLDQFSLGDPSMGGLGSYSLILMVVCYLQHYWLGKQNLGTLLIGFCTFFGKLFNFRTTGIDVQNACFYPLPAGTDNVLIHIRDPLNSDNNVSRSTSRFDEIRGLLLASAERLRESADLYALIDSHALAKVRKFRDNILRCVYGKYSHQFGAWTSQRRRVEIDKRRGESLKRKQAESQELDSNTTRQTNDQETAVDNRAKRAKLEKNESIAKPPGPEAKPATQAKKNPSSIGGIVSESVPKQQPAKQTAPIQQPDEEVVDKELQSAAKTKKEKKNKKKKKKKKQSSSESESQEEDSQLTKEEARELKKLKKTISRRFHRVYNLGMGLTEARQVAEDLQATEMKLNIHK